MDEETKLQPGKLPILCYPDPHLREATVAVTDIDSELLDLTTKMVATMRDAEGIGLAAPQIGRHEKIIVVDTSENHETVMLLANPEVVSASKKLNEYEEGCLSIPGVVAKVKRPEQVTVSALNLETGQVQIYEAEGLLATCLQHEIDHLNGILFIDHLTRLNRSRLLRQYQKQALKQTDSKSKL